MSAVERNPVVRPDGNFYDPLCVCGKCFQPVLVDLMAATDKERPAETPTPGRMVAPVNRSSRATNVSHNRQLVCDESGVNPRKLQGYLKAEWATVSLRDADALLAAFGRADVLQTLTVLVRRGAQFRLPADRHACELLAPEDSSSACRLAAVEPSLRTTAPVAEDLLVSTSDREAEAPAVERRAA